MHVLVRGTGRLQKHGRIGAFLQLRWGPLAGTGHIPTDEMEMATHLYLALQAFFRRYEDLQQRPFIITGVRPAQSGTSLAVAVAGSSCRVSCGVLKAALMESNSWLIELRLCMSGLA